eukprot:ANDGO_05616.mRNA.1 hypothetical protein
MSTSTSRHRHVRPAVSVSHRATQQLKMSLRERLLLSPWQKWRKYGKFPFKAFIHVLLVALVTLQCFLFGAQRNTYLYSQTSAFEDLFFPSGAIVVDPKDSGYGSAYVEFARIGDWLSGMQNAVNTYALLNDISPDTYGLVDRWVRMSVAQLAHEDVAKLDYTKPMDRSVSIREYWVDPFSNKSMYGISNPPRRRSAVDSILHTTTTAATPGAAERAGTGAAGQDAIVVESASIAGFWEENFGDVDDPMDEMLGPFNTSDAKSVHRMMSRVVFVDLSFQVEAANLLPNVPQCMEWTIKIHYDFAARGGLIRQFIQSDAKVCESQSSKIIDASASPVIWISVLCIITSLFSILLTVRQMVSILSIRSHLPSDTVEGSVVSRSMSPSPSPSPSPMPTVSSNIHFNLAALKTVSFGMILGLLNLWTIVHVISAVMSIVSSGMLIATTLYKYADEETVAFFVGFDALFSWVNLCRYFEYSPKFYLLILTVRRGMPNVVRFIIGTAPIFIGYTVLGTVLFGPYTRFFADFDQAAVTLFAVLNGDEIHDVTAAVFSRNPALGIISRIYMFSFVALFIYTVLNIFIHIMEDGFFSAKENPGTTARAEKIANLILGPSAPPPPPVVHSRLGDGRSQQDEESRLLMAQAHEEDSSSPGNLLMMPVGGGSAGMQSEGFSSSATSSAFPMTAGSSYSSQGNEPADHHYHHRGHQGEGQPDHGHPFHELLGTLEQVQQYLRYAVYGSGISPEERFCLQLIQDSSRRLLSVRSARHEQVGQRLEPQVAPGIQ